MATLIDSSLWIDFTRAKSSRTLKQFIAPYLLDRDVWQAEPILFEVFRYANEKEVPQIQAMFRALPILQTPADVWSEAAKLGQTCRKKGINCGALDLLIAQVSISHNSTLVTFDEDFQEIARVSTLRLKLLKRPKA